MGKSYDVLVWANYPEDIDIPFLFDEMTDEYINLTYKQAKKIYNQTKNFHYKVIKEYASSDPDEEAEDIEEDYSNQVLDDMQHKD